MNIQEDIRVYLKETKIKANRLAVMSGVGQPTIWRLLHGQSGCHSRTIEKLWPVLYDDPNSPLYRPPSTAEDSSPEEMSDGQNP